MDTVVKSGIVQIRGQRLGSTLWEEAGLQLTDPQREDLTYKQHIWLILQLLI